MSYTRKLIHPLEEQLNEAKEDEQVRQILEAIMRYKPKDDEKNAPRLDVAIDIALEMKKYYVVMSLPPSSHLISYMEQLFLHQSSGFYGFYSFLKSQNDLPQAQFYLGLKAYSQMDRDLLNTIKYLDSAKNAITADWFPAEGFHILGYAYFYSEKKNSLLAAQYFQEAILKSNGNTHVMLNYRSYFQLLLIMNHTYGLKVKADKKWNAVRQAKDAAPVTNDYVSKFTDTVVSVISFPFTLWSSSPTLADSAPKEISLSEVLGIIYFCIRQEKNLERYLYQGATFDELGFLSQHVFDELDFFADPEEAARWAETLAKAAGNRIYDQCKPEHRASWVKERISTIPKELALQKQLLLEKKSKKSQPEAPAVEQEYKDEACRQRSVNR